MAVCVCVCLGEGRCWEMFCGKWRIADFPCLCTFHLFCPCHSHLSSDICFLRICMKVSGLSVYISCSILLFDIWFSLSYSSSWLVCISTPPVRALPVLPHLSQCIESGNLLLSVTVDLWMNGVPLYLTLRCNFCSFSSMSHTLAMLRVDTDTDLWGSDNTETHTVPNHFMSQVITHQVSSGQSLFVEKHTVQFVVKTSKRKEVFYCFFFPFSVCQAFIFPSVTQSGGLPKDRCNREGLKCTGKHLKRNLKSWAQRAVENNYINPC